MTDFAIGKRAIRVGIAFASVALVLLTAACSWKSAEQAPSAAPLPVPAQTAAPPVPAGADKSAATSAKSATGDSADTVSDMQAERCIAARGKPRAAREVAVHRWVDANGIIHFSDHAPAGAVQDYSVSAVADAPSVDVDVSGYDTNLPTDADARAVSDALAIDRILRQISSSPDAVAPDTEKLALRIVFVRNRDTYRGLIGEPRLADSDGAYSSGDSTIHVLVQPSDERTFAIMRHEIAHAVIHERIGILAIPINEGLAVYAENLHVVNGSPQLRIGGLGHALARALPHDPKSALGDLLARDETTFYQNGDSAHGSDERELRYLRAFALVATLMRDEPGRAAMARLLVEQRGNPCRTANAAAIFDKTYPGGLAQLALDWAAWMKNAGTAGQSG